MFTLLITGANRGLGLEFAKQYAAAGWRVLACCRAPENADKLQALADATQGRVTLHALDVADLSAIDDLAQQLRGTPVDLIINNAGIYPDRTGGFGQLDYDAWMMAFLVNTMAPMKITEAFISNLESGKGKTVATVSSKMGSLDDNTSGESLARSTRPGPLGVTLDRTSPRVQYAATSASVPFTQPRR